MASAKSSSKPLSPGRARHEARLAGWEGRTLPRSHPYALVPLWTPFWFASLVGRVAGLFSRDAGKKKIRA